MSRAKLLLSELSPKEGRSFWNLISNTSIDVPIADGEILRILIQEDRVEEGIYCDLFFWNETRKKSWFPIFEGRVDESIDKLVKAVSKGLNQAKKEIKKAEKKYKNQKESK